MNANLEYAKIDYPPLATRVTGKGLPATHKEA